VRAPVRESRPFDRDAIDGRVFRMIPGGTYIAIVAALVSTTIDLTVSNPPKAETIRDKQLSNVWAGITK